MRASEDERPLGGLPELRRLLAERDAQLLRYAADFNLLLRSERAQAEEIDQLKSELEAARTGRCAYCELAGPDGAAVASADRLQGALTAHQHMSAELERAHYETAMRLTRAAQLKSAELGGHLTRISRFSAALARELKVAESSVRVLAAAAPLHDIGKIGIPDEILHKDGPLTEPEWRTVRRHTILGGELLASSSSRLLQAAREIALTHHERWDGSGYPRGLKGKEIPLFGRIVNIADQYDALRSERPYKPAFSHDTTCRILLEGDGRTRPGHFDPDLLGAFRSVKSRLAEIFDSVQCGSGGEAASELPTVA